MLIPFLLLLLAVEGYTAGGSRFTNVQCEILDIGYITYPQCELKVLGRGIVGLNVIIHLLKPPVTTVKVNLSLFRKYSGFRPFMFNKTFDYCRFAANKNPTLSFESIVFSAIGEKSNLNHSCPFDHDIIIRSMVFKQEYLRLLPLPTGEYRFQFSISTNNILRTKIYANILHNENTLNS